MARILIVDDDAALRDTLAAAVADLGHLTLEAGDGAEALAMIQAGSADAVILDLRMAGMEGLEVLRRLQGSHPPPITVLTAHATAANTIEAMRLGAVDHLTKPITQAELKRAIETMLMSHVTAGPIARRDLEPDEFVGSSAALRSVQKAIGRLADSDTTILISGETGTGKELVARAIHSHGRRGKKPFIAVNCAAIPRDLLESELFGHVRGAFTGATGDRAGAFRDADAGILFLDEVGDMDLAMQAKILRVLQDGIVTPVGGRPVKVDVRIIAATNRNLEQRVHEGVFREDLFYRLNVVPVHLPPLRERIADIVPLAEHFLRRARGPGLGPAAAAVLLRYEWPGNVRELKNAMQRATALVRTPMLAESDFSFLASAPRSPKTIDWPEEDLASALARLEEMLIRRALDRCQGNRAEAARMLGIRRQHLYSRLERYGIVSAERTDDVPFADTNENGAR
jgi:DNA-binding NtrC family response regulator